MIIIRYLRCREGTLRCREKGWPLNTGKLRGVDCIRSQGRLCVRERVRGRTRRNAGDDLFIYMCLIDNRLRFFAVVYMSDSCHMHRCIMSHLWINAKKRGKLSIQSSRINVCFELLSIMSIYTRIRQKRPIYTKRDLFRNILDYCLFKYEWIICVYSFICVTWRIRRCDMSLIIYAFLCVAWVSFICVTRFSFICVTWIYSRTHSYVWHTSLSLCDVTRSYEWHDSSRCVTWVYSSTHSYVWHDSHLHVWHGSHSYVSHETRLNVWHGSYSYVWREIYSYAWHESTHSYVWHDSFICVSWIIRICDIILIHMCDTGLIHINENHVTYMNDSYVWHESFTCVIRLIHMCAMTHSYVCHDSFIYAKVSGLPVSCRGAMRWLRLVASLKLQVSFAEYSLSYRSLL